MKRILIFSLVTFVAGCHSAEPDKKPVVDVKVQRVVAQNVPLVVSGPATIFGKSEAKIASRVTAPIARLLVHKGDSVKKGELLAVLDNADLRAQSADAGATVFNAQANLQRTQAGSVPTELSQARADLEAKTATYSLAKEVSARRRKLLQEGAISGREAQISQADEVQAKANYDAAKTRLTLIEQQTSGADVKIAQSNVAQARARQQLAAANLSFTELRSPMDGSVTDQTMFPGDMANPSMPIFALADLSSAVARAQIDADQAASVHVGQACSFELKPDAGGDIPQRSGRVTVVNQAVDPARHTVEVWCEIPNADGVLKSGIFGSVKIAVGQATHAVVIPSSAIEFEEGTNSGKVFTVDAQKVAHLRKVQAVALDDMHVRVLSGLAPGETVISTGEYGLPDGTSVNPTEVHP